MCYLLYMGLFACTLTGVDEKTDLGRLLDLSARFPFVEWGILISSSPGAARYPSPEWVASWQAPSGPGAAGVHYAFHLCGRTVYDFLAGDEAIRRFAYSADRIQLNFNHRRKPVDLIALTNEVQPASAPAIIIQEHAGNAGLNACRLGCRHQVVFDASGGRGKLADEWPKPLSGFIQGYAGGLAPENISQELPKIASVAGDVPFWVDMESGVRDGNDVFDLDRCESVLAQVGEFLRAGSPVS